MQTRLVFWASYYQSILELPSWERPAEDVLADDEELDRWYENRLRQMDREARDAQRAAAQRPRR